MFLAVMGRDHSDGVGLWVLASETDVYMMKMLQHTTYIPKWRIWFIYILTIWPLTNMGIHSMWHWIWACCKVLHLGFSWCCKQIMIHSMRHWIIRIIIRTNFTLNKTHHLELLRYIDHWPVTTWGIELVHGKFEVSGVTGVSGVVKVFVIASGLIKYESYRLLLV